MRFCEKLAASRKWFPSSSIKVSPVNTAPFSTTSFTANWRGVTAGFHPEMVPFSVEKMKSAGAGVFAATFLIRKSVVPLKRTPVGDELPLAPGAFGTTTGEGGETTLPAPVYRAEVPVPALLIHQGLDALRV